MPRHCSQQSYIADGFIHDCDELIYRCIQGDSFNYQVFCNIWKDMGLYNIFVGRPRGAEIAELSEEVIHVAKRYLVGNNSNIEENIAGLFLVYALVNIQPYKRFAYLRLVAEDIETLRNIEGIARRDKRIDVLYILGSVLIKGPVRYVASPREYGLELSVRKYIAGYASMDTTSCVKGVFFRKREELDLIREMNSLSKKYAEAKNALIKSGQWSKSLNYSNDNLAAELESSLKKLKTGSADDDDDDDGESGLEGPAPAPHGSDVRSIKDRAMAGAVNPMRHLIAVTDRRSPAKKQVTPVKDARFKMPVSPEKSRKRLGILLRSRFRRRHNSDDEYEDINDNDAPSRVDLAAIDAEIETEEQEINIQIDSLPVFSRVEQNGRHIEFEIIDNFKAQETKHDVPAESKEKKFQKELMGPPKKIPKQIKVDKEALKAKASTSKVEKDVNSDTLPSIDIDDETSTKVISKGLILKSEDKSKESRLDKNCKIEISITPVSPRRSIRSKKCKLK